MWLTILWILTLSGPAATTAPAGDRATVIVVVGAEGEPEYGREFAASADRWREAAARASAEVVEVGRQGSGSDDADKKQLRAALETATKTTPPTRPLWLVFIGHGTHDGREAKFNLRGQDVSDQELAAWLKDCKRPLAVINCASSSGPFLKRLSGPNRVVVTATRSGSESNFARFGNHLSGAVADPAADLDKDGQTSLLEAFLAASHRVNEFYKQEARLATEHALLEDNGDGFGIPADWFRGTRATRSAKDGAPLDGTRAHQWHLVLSESERAMPAAFRAERDKLELEVEALRAKKANMAEGDYYAKLEPLLVRLARLYRDHSGPDGAKEPTPEPIGGSP
jgi:hypothetical protein